MAPINILQWMLCYVFSIWCNQIAQITTNYSSQDLICHCQHSSAFYLTLIPGAKPVDHLATIVFTAATVRDDFSTFTFAIICHHPSVCLSSVCNVRAPYSSRRLKFSAMFLLHLVRWSSVDIQVKFYANYFHDDIFGSCQMRGEFSTVLPLRYRLKTYQRMMPIL